jgi:pyridinium-3,5-biscarboxylic acid mononucleotide sulfurtransferase
MGIDKPAILLLAAELGLGALAALPSAPCLASRIETGIRIEASVLLMVQAAEHLVQRRLMAATVWCRVCAAGLVIELDQASFDALSVAQTTALTAELVALARGVDLDAEVSFAPCRTGRAIQHITA